ncbi:hypothetical protein [Rhodocista pekingensis]|uniref:Anti-sigma factor n=1 Tax=Rhodocista pekingensis TaxID=201185 RepID=A0ABW2KTN8_9PROT
MIGRPPPVAEEELHELVDGALPPARRAVVLAYLAANPAAAARVAAWQAQNEGLRALFGAGEGAGPVPRAAFEAWRRETAGLARQVRPPSPFRRGGRVVLAGALCAAALLAVAVLPGWRAGPGGADFYGFSRSALEAHARTVADAGGAIPAATGVLAGVRPPDLSPLGWRLDRRRPVPLGDRAGLQFVYREAGGARHVSLIVGPPAEAAEGTFSYMRQGSRTLFTWLDGELGYALVGDLGRGELLRLADAVHAGLSPDGAHPRRALAPPRAASLHPAVHRPGM